MKDNELIKLVDDLTLAALRHESAKQNLEKTAEEFNVLAEKFNNESENIREELLTNEEFAFSIGLVDKIFKRLNIEEIL